MRALALKIPPVVVVLALAGLMGAATRFAPDLTVAIPAHRALAGVVAAAGAAIALVGVAAFRRAKTTVNPLAPAAVSALVVTGIYRRTRNPMYLGMLLLLLGVALWSANALSFLVAAGFVPLMNRLQIGPEEEILAARFGAEFAAYRSRVRRWL